MQCPNCQHWNEPGSRFCEECGLELPASTGTNQVSVRATAVQPSVGEADAVDFSEFVDKQAPSSVSSSPPPAPSEQELTPIDSPPPAPYTGPRLVLKSSGSIFRLGSAAVIGREDPTLQIDLEGYPDGKFVSHRHAQIVKMNDQYYIEDLGSSNHTFVNDMKLAEGQSEPLKQGDTIKLGKIELTYHESLERGRTVTTPAQERIKCPHCGKMTGTSSGFCDECGLELSTQALKPVTAAQVMASGQIATTSDKLICPFCGFKLRPNARHCPNCGKKLTNAAPAPKEVELTGPPSAIKVGILISERYGVEGLLGQGGMGRAWKAYDRNLNKYVVIKTVVAADEGLREALQKEAETLINIRHPNIISVIDFFLIGNELCYVMEFIDGPSWADEIEEPGSRRLVLPMPAAQALDRIKGLLPAFKYLHGLNPPIIYCDFKPSNVKRMTLPNGEQIEILLDFGTAYRYDPNKPPKPARGTPGYHSPQALHPDWRDDYFTIGRTLAELIGMAEVHTEQYRYTLTPPDVFPWIQYDESLRYFVEWLTAHEREDRPQSVDAIIAEIDGVIGYVKGQSPDIAAFKRQRASFQGVTLETLQAHNETGVVTGTIKIDLPEIAPNNPASTVLLTAQEAYQQRDYKRALQLTNQAINNKGGASAYLLRSLINTQNGKLQDSEADLKSAQAQATPQAQWEFLLAEGQFLENTGRFEEAAERYRRMMALRPGDYRARLLLADLYRRSGNTKQAIAEYRAIIQSKPSIGQAYIGASKAYLSDKQIDEAIKVLEEVSSRNTSYNEVMLELISLYNLKADEGSAATLEEAARAISVLRENGVETRSYYRLLAEFYFTAYAVAKKSGQVPAINWPDQQMQTLADISRANEHAWREYLARDEDADREFVINDRIMAARAWAMV